MSGKPQYDEGRLDPGLKARITKRVAQVAFLFIFQAALLFLSSGRFDWIWAWVFLSLSLIGASINFAIMLRYSPRTIALRAEARGMKNWDKLIGGLWAVMYFVLMLVLAGLDQRYGWTEQIGLAPHIAGAVVFALGFALFSWAMISNAYFAAVVRIQQGHHHLVCTNGPYRYVRHPGYAGAIFQSLALPLMLSSIWALIPGALAAVLMVVRTVLEDKTLQQELHGYKKYVERVRYRLLPRIW